MNDILYAIGGTTHTMSVISYFEPTAVNEQYTPAGYGILWTVLVCTIVAAITIIAVAAVSLKKNTN